MIELDIKVTILFSSLLQLPNWRNFTID